ncbi:hypothetical protein HYH03_003518 [Edaphochlamys debaryana]|uniref:Pherophorin domain-containing protein n=1 Tax=Edaphochlamys debaryana TaxID=47281 RepID=A0A835YBQ0_9CHLO|nr:hypothetical protein HYH03_003518 [Edaphochlamys debaryana]|eukprot:KAG2498779.1 hypothetical protein HYH03_003518 [Edaphochlamys debaryana]
MLACVSSRRSPPSPPPPSPRKIQSCKTCWVLEINGPDGTPASSTWDFLGYKSCAYEGWSSNPADNPFPNCCAKFAHYLLRDFNSTYSYTSSPYDNDTPAKDLLTVSNLSVTCSKTSLHMCGTVTSDRLGKDLLPYMDPTDNENWMFSMTDTWWGPFDNTDDSCPMAMVNSTARVHTVRPSTGAADASCFPTDSNLPINCGMSTRQELAESYGSPLFPLEKCDASPGATPFKAEPYLEVVRGANVSHDCVQLNLAKPTDPKSACGKASSLNKVSFWLDGDNPELVDYIKQGGVWLRTKDSRGAYQFAKKLSVSWSTKDKSVLYARGLKLKASDFAAKQPQICFAHGNESWENIWVKTKDGLGYLWTALYDSTGTCCPAWYSNRF